MAIIESDATFTFTGSNVDVANRELLEQPDRPRLTLIEGGRATPLIGARELLLASVERSAAWYTEVTADLNKGRAADQQIQIVPENELADRADDWLTQGRYTATRAENGLYVTDSNPLIVLALPNAPISHRETVNSWAKSRDGQLTRWSGRMAFLNHWSANELSGFDPSQADEPVRFVVIETAYQENRRGNRENQVYQLRKNQLENPLLGSATLFEGGVLARQTSETSFDAWQQTVVRDIGLQPNHDNQVPLAFLDHNGQAIIGQSSWGYTHVARRKVA